MHFTDACADSWPWLFSTWQGPNPVRVSAHFCVRQDGGVEQWVDTDVVAHHARQANSYYIGIEHVADPPTCNLNALQLDVSAQLSGWLAYIYGFPIVRSFGCAFRPGFKAHNDGLQPGCGWNGGQRGRHYDGIWRSDVTWLRAAESQRVDRSPWSWNDYAAATTYYLSAMIEWYGYPQSQGLGGGYYADPYSGYASPAAYGYGYWPPDYYGYYDPYGYYGGTYYA
jgi:hypothetical protein